MYLLSILIYVNQLRNYEMNLQLCEHLNKLFQITEARINILRQIMQNQKVNFELNKTDISSIGFDLSTSSRLCQQLVSPFQDQQDQPHPLRAVFPDGFNSFDFTMDKVTSRLTDDILIYMFYNIIDEKVQLYAGRQLVQKGFRYHKKHKVWVRKFEKQFKFFNINQWKYQDFVQNIKQQDFCNKEDFSEK